MAKGEKVWNQRNELKIKMSGMGGKVIDKIQKRNQQTAESKNHRDAKDLGGTLQKVLKIRMGRKFKGRNGNLYIFNTGEENWRLRIFH